MPVIPSYYTTIWLATPGRRKTPSDAHAHGATARTQSPKTMPKNCHLCYHIVFTVMPFVLYDIYRTEDHKRRGRASKISTISTCFSFVCHKLLPPHPISVRKGWGYHCRVLVWLLALFAKLNRFFPNPDVRFELLSGCCFCGEIGAVSDPGND